MCSSTLDAGSVPVDQGADGEAVPQLMGRGVDGGGAQPHRGGELPEGVGHVAAVEPRADAGDEERRRAGCWAEAIALGRVGAQRGGGRGVQRHQAWPVELGVTDGDDAMSKVDVIAVEAGRLADAHARHGEQPEQRLVGGCPQRRGQRPGAVQEPADVPLRPQVGGRAMAAGREHAHRRHLGRRLDRLQVAGEPAGDR